jgi:hypothetical protein
MSIGVKIKKMFRGGASNFDPAGQLVIVDGSTLYEGRRGGSKLTPRDQIDMLQALSNICTREKFVVQVVFAGEPLRKVDHGEFFDEVKVLYAQDGVTTTDLVMELIAATTLKQIVVVSSNVGLETKAASKGAVTLRAATFRKGFEEFNPGSGGGNRRGGNSPQRRRRKSGGGEDEKSRGGGNRGHRGGGQGRGGGGNKDEDSGNKDEDSGNKDEEGGGGRRSGNRKPRSGKPRQESSEPDVSDLIDLIE